TWTWSSATGDRRRLDYIALPQAWAEFSVQSETWYSFEAMQKRDDHVPTAVRCTFQRVDHEGSAATFRRQACRPNDLDPKLDKEAFRQALSQRHVPDWSLSVDTHFDAFVQSWTAAGKAASATEPVPPRQSFLTQDTMQLVAARKAQQRAAEWLKDVEISIARAWASLNYACRLLRGAVKVDRNKYLDRLVQEVTVADLSHPRQLFQRVRKAFPKAAAARRSTFTALPAVECADGALAVTAEGRAERWREHFSEQECGSPVDAQGYLRLLAQKDAASRTQDVRFDPAMLPSLSSLESIILGLRRAKAAGPDGITAELLKLSPALAARHLVALHLKSVLAVQEPVEYKGGALMTLVKKAAAMFRCDRYRSILLSGVTGKVFHKSLRDQAHAKSTGQLAALVFYDV
ncbi:Cacna1h, partial [Symbiodinium necroappetens]